MSGFPGLYGHARAGGDTGERRAAFSFCPHELVLWRAAGPDAGSRLPVAGRCGFITPVDVTAWIRHPSAEGGDEKDQQNHGQPVTLTGSDDGIRGLHETVNQRDQGAEQGNGHGAGEVQGPSQAPHPLPDDDARIPGCEIEKHEVPVTGIRVEGVEIFKFHRLAVF